MANQSAGGIHMIWLHISSPKQSCGIPQGINLPLKTPALRRNWVTGNTQMNYFTPETETGFLHSYLRLLHDMADCSLKHLLQQRAYYWCYQSPRAESDWHCTERMAQRIASVLSTGHPQMLVCCEKQISDRSWIFTYSMRKRHHQILVLMLIYLDIRKLNQEQFGDLSLLNRHAASQNKNIFVPVPLATSHKIKVERDLPVSPATLLGYNVSLHYESNLNIPTADSMCASTWEGLSCNL